VSEIDPRVEAVARAIYAVLPNGGYVRQPTTAGGWEKVFEADAWEEAPDRHDVCYRQARAAIAALGEGSAPTGKETP
jgi:hypothetical protein